MLNLDEAVKKAYESIRRDRYEDDKILIHISNLVSEAIRQNANERSKLNAAINKAAEFLGKNRCCPPERDDCGDFVDCAHCWQIYLMRGMDEPEYLESRCCLCPNVGKDEESDICPGIPGTSHPDPSPCRFVKTYVDERGWKYRVMPGIGINTYKARYQKPGKPGWHGVAKLPWRESFDVAQADLNRLAKEKQWDEA